MKQDGLPGALPLDDETLGNLKRAKATTKPGKLATSPKKARGILGGAEAIRLLEDITQAIIESPDLPSALQVALEKVCKATGWSYGEVWIPQPGGAVVKCHAAWHRKSKSLGTFLKATRRMTPSLGVGLVGRVWASQQPEWIANISGEPGSRLLRAPLARESGLRAGFALPLVAGGEVLAVFVFFLAAAQKENQQAGALVATVAHQLGSFIQRQRAEEALRRANEGLEAEVRKRTNKFQETNTTLRAEVRDRQRAEETLRQERNFISTILGTVDALVVVLDLEGRIVYFNRACEQATGYTFEEVRGQPFWELLLVPEEREPVKKVFQELRLRALPNQFENLWVGKNGERRRIAWSNNVFRDEKGDVVHVIGTGIDITERHQALEAVRENEATIRALLEATSQSILAVDAEGRIVLANSVTEKIFGYPSEEIIGRPLEILLPKTLWERHARHRAGYFSQPRTRPMCPGLELVGRRRDGTEFPVEVGLSYIQTKQGMLAVSFLSDITERKRAEEALRESEEKFRVLAESMAAALIIIQGDRIRYVNPATEGLTGYTRDELLTMHYWDYIHPEFREIVRQRGLARQRGEPVPSRYEQKIITKKGEERWFDFTAGLTTFEGKPAGLGTAFDITERKRAEEELRHSDSRTRALLNAIPDLMFRYRTDGTYLDFHAHDPSELAIAPEVIVGSTIYQLPLPRDIIDRLMAVSRKAMETSQVQTVEYDVNLPAGTNTYEARIVASGDDELVAIVRNITERRRAEEELSAAAAALRKSRENLQALTAQLISAREEETKHLARELHDVFSQRLAVLGMETAGVEQRFVCSDPACCKTLHDIGEEIGSLAKDVHQLSRKLHPSILDDLGLTAALRAECGDFSRQHSIPVQFEPVHVPESLPGPVSLGLYRIAQESLRNVGRHAGATVVRVSLDGSGGAIRLSVEDNGCGFDFGQIKGRRGLGLVSMEERVRLAEGSIAVRSQPGAGTTIEVRIPLSRSER
ncbi:MAG: hypothetical protein A3J28_00565 [Acidobacteria bacterium RIFCSPLOWO2_12_FULL_60_22]|nr:MAG: hypothetical protein A3J28_00565 [Acidobacteria bacterium RIFCSPLOWO2_12_FULL_60_22]